VNVKKFKVTIGGREIALETGRLAKQSASILATWWRRKPVETTRPVGSYLGTP